MGPTQDFSFFFLLERDCNALYRTAMSAGNAMICQQRDLQKPSWCTVSFKEFFTDAKKNVISHVSQLTQDTLFFLCQQCALLQMSVWTVQLAVSMGVICRNHPDSWCTHSSDSC